MFSFKDESMRRSRFVVCVSNRKPTMGIQQQGSGIGVSSVGDMFSVSTDHPLYFGGLGDRLLESGN